MEIRQAVEEDYKEIYDLVKTAFETAKVSDGKEQEFVLEHRMGDNYLPGLEFVAEENGSLIAHIMLTKQVLYSENESFTGVLVAPLCVFESYRNRGTGAKLMTYALQQAVKTGYTAAFLVGDQNYYGRFGYRRLSDFHIHNKTQIPDRFVLGCELVPDALIAAKGMQFYC